MEIGKLRGADFAFDHAIEVDVAGKLPEGGHNKLKVRVPTVAAFVCMKSIAMSERKKEKDAYDIYFCLRHYPGGPKALAEAFRDLRDLEIAKEALCAMRSKFRDIDQIGPVWAAKVAEEHGDDLEFVQRDAYERVTLLLDTLGIK